MPAMLHNGQWHLYSAEKDFEPLKLPPGFPPLIPLPGARPRVSRFVGVWLNLATGRGGGVPAMDEEGALRLAREEILKQPPAERVAALPQDCRAHVGPAVTVSDDSGCAIVR
ncbi:unnamed protein product [Gemmata massiliana]|uniref:Uncharacterized protein n=1 Tax=Gemmata massiliana TaxID=1210884 RepID=A0A6P2DBY0_9BACT|nr:hypothetical protein [Gemmata massiliana]VTR98746.1 unnamed protein product [Gemmata massiliana]